MVYSMDKCYINVSKIKKFIFLGTITFIVKRKFSDIFRFFMPFSSYKKAYIKELSEFIEKDDLKKVKYLSKTGRIGFSSLRLGVTEKIIPDFDYPQINLACIDNDVRKFVEKINSDITYKVKKNSFREFSKDAANKIKKFIAPNIIGLETIKEAAVLQLFASDRIHMLLLGDPQTGKTDILRAVADIYPITSFGLGSGASGVGLSVTVKGNEIVKGLLPLADRGICCIDELNLLKQSDRASLYSAMEKGFVTYDKGSKHITLQANIRLLATANPKFDKFVGRSIDILKEQIPFDEALLSRFHLVFLIKQPDLKNLLEITKKIAAQDNIILVNEDINFIKDYINFTEDIKVDFPREFDKEIVNFIEHLKVNEKNFIVRIGPRTVIGFIRLCKANARLNMRDEVLKEDLKKVKKIFEEALFIRKKD